MRTLVIKMELTPSIRPLVQVCMYVTVCVVGGGGECKVNNITTLQLLQGHAWYVYVWHTYATS